MQRPLEFEFIERYLARSVADPAVLVGIGDDAAVVAPEGRIAIAVDTLVGGTHFPETLAADAVAHRALAVNLSDLAAIGARPRWATLALSLPGADATWLEAFSSGFFSLAERFAVSLIGGDLTRGPLAVTVQVIGDQAGEPLLRSGGSAGDLLFVSGSLGDGAAGLECLYRDDPDEHSSALVRRFTHPEPRIDLGLKLTGIARAAIDVSDGLVSDLGHICASSECGARIELESLPISESLAAFAGGRRTEYALNGGDDYELLFAVDAADAGRVREAAARARTAITEIGTLTEDRRIVGFQNRKEVVLEPRGFRHFG